MPPAYLIRFSDEEWEAFLKICNIRLVRIVITYFRVMNYESTNRNRTKFWFYEIASSRYSPKCYLSAHQDRRSEELNKHPTILQDVHVFISCRSVYICLNFPFVVAASFSPLSVHSDMKRSRDTTISFKSVTWCSFSSIAIDYLVGTFFLFITIFLHFK